MSVALYKINNSKGEYEYQKLVTPMVGKSGLLTRSVRGRVTSGAWRVEARDLLKELEIGADRDSFAIIIDLVPRGPEWLLGRVESIKGYLRPDGFNPFRIDMSAILDDQTPTKKRDGSPRKRIPLDTTPRHLRTINYLIRYWNPRGPFGGAILRRDQWKALTADPWPAGSE